MQGGGQGNAQQPGNQRPPGVPYLVQHAGNQVPMSQAPRATAHVPQPYSYPQMLAPGAMQPGQYQHHTQSPNPTLSQPPSSLQHAGRGQPLAQQPHRPAQPSLLGIQQPANQSPYISQAHAGMQAAIDLLAQGQRAYANAQRPAAYGSLARPLAPQPNTGMAPRPAMGPVRPPPVSAAPAARKYNKKRKSPESSIAPQPRVVALVPCKMPNSELLTELQSMNDSVNKAMAAQRQEVRHSLKPQEHVKKKLRVYVHSKHYNQPQSQAYDLREPSFWDLIIWGKVMDVTSGSNLAGFRPPTGGFHKARYLPFYLKSVGMTFLGPDKSDPPVLWEKSKHAGDLSNHIYFRHEGSTERNVEIQIHTDSQPAVWETDEKLASLTGLKQAPRTAILHSLWTYIKLHKLLGDQDVVTADEKLEELLGASSFTVAELPKLLEDHIRPRGPAKIQFTIRPNVGDRSSAACFDLELYVPVKPEDKQSAPLLDQLQPDPEIEQLQAKINGLVTAANERVRRWETLLGFGADPQGFIEKAIAGQGREVRATQRGGAATAMRKTEFFKSKWVENAVLRYLHRKMAAGA